jgi:hypothetical protein
MAILLQALSTQSVTLRCPCRHRHSETRSRHRQLPTRRNTDGLHDDPNANTGGAKTDSIKRGFVKHFVDFIAKKGHATVAELQAEFTGRQFDNKKVTNERVVRYAYWCMSNGILKVAAKAKAAKGGAR